MVGNVHNTRILRFLLVIGAVILTIFIYASYSTSPQLGPAHMHTHLSLPPEALQQQISINNKTGELTISGILLSNGVTVDSNGGDNNLKLNYDKHQSNVHQGSKRKIYYANNVIDGNPLKKQHRQPTVDVDAGGSDIPSNNPIDDGPADEAALDRLVSNYFLEEQYLSNVDNAMGNINNSGSVTIGGEGAGPNNSKISDMKQNNDPHHRQSQNQDALENMKKTNNNNNNNDNNKGKSANKVLESDVLIPTSNLQKFIENADKILKNMTSATSNSIIVSQHQQQQQKPEEMRPELVKKPQDSENKDGDEKKPKEIVKSNIEDVDDDYDESQQSSVIMTIKSASKVLSPDEEKKDEQEGGQGGQGQSEGEGKQQLEKEKLNDSDRVKSILKAVESNDQRKPNEMPASKQVTQSAPAVAMKIALQQRQSQANGGGGSSAAGGSRPELKLGKDKATADPVQSSPAQAVLQTPSKPVGSAVSTKNTTNQLGNKPPIDTSQGIPTMQLYESGHLDDELDIDRICPHQGADLKLLILITSAQSHQEARLAVRQTWGHYGSRRDVSTAFVLGRSANRTLNLALTQENFIYGDLIRGNFIDSYNNLTLKTISSLEWVDKHCSRAKFILKTDDDMFINVPKLLQFLDGHSKDKRTIFGRLAKKWKPVRNKKSKYYVSTTQFSATVFPSFTTGPAYVLTSDIIHDLYDRSLQQVYFKLEDVFTTGIVAQQLNIKRIHVNEFLNRRIAFNPCNIRKTISVHMIKANEQFDLWKKLLDQTTKCK